MARSVQLTINRVRDMRRATKQTFTVTSAVEMGTKIFVLVRSRTIVNSPTYVDSWARVASAEDVALLPADSPLGTYGEFLTATFSISHDTIVDAIDFATQIKSMVDRLISALNASDVTESESVTLTGA